MGTSEQALFGSPQRFWSAEVPPAPLRRRPAPSLDDFNDFMAMVELRSPRWQGPALLLGLAVFCAAFTFVPHSAGPLEISPTTRQVALWVLAGVFAAAGIAVLLWDLRTRADSQVRAHERFLEHGIIAHAYLTGLNVDHESFQPAWVLIDAGVSDDQAARLYAAFDAWLNAVQEDKKLHARVRTMFHGKDGLVASETLFGPDAAGGYLAGPYKLGHWKGLLPKGTETPTPRAEGGRWRTFTIYAPDPSGEAQPTVGTGTQS